MSIVTESPVNSSSSDDFATLLGAELDSTSSDTSPSRDEDHNHEFESGSVKRLKVEDALQMSSSQIVEVSVEPSITVVDICKHPGTIRGLCIGCGKIVEEDSGDVAFRYVHKDMRLGGEEIVRLRQRDMKNLLRNRKLYLVLDLDHTLLNSTRLMDLTPKEEYLKNNQDLFKGSLYTLDNIQMMTKLRPSVHTFLEVASGMFEMYIYTMGERPYALQMAALLDPKGTYFSSRVISQSDSTQRHQKGLDVVVAHENALVIIDDTEAVWSKHRENLILIERYHFFSAGLRQFGFDCNSPSETRTDESESEGALSTILQLLHNVHRLFYHSETEAQTEKKDVREILKMVQKDVLKGCRIIFSGIFRVECGGEGHVLWKTAEQLGATCLPKIDHTVTHVVSTNVTTEKSIWAVKEKRWLVHPRWIEAARHQWKKPPEPTYSLVPTTTTTN